MSEAEQLIEVKKGLGITGTYQDGTILRHLKDVKAFMASAGVRSDLMESEASVGLLLRGVADLWNTESGTVGFRPYFYQRLIQLKTLPDPEVTSV